MNPMYVIIAIVFYCSFLFFLGYWAERNRSSWSQMKITPYVYALASTVYCTSWTFYGSVRQSAQFGLSFLAIYLGPSLALWAGRGLLKRLIELKDRHKLTNLADLLAFRYGKSQVISSVVAGLYLLAIIPYIGLQFRALEVSSDIIFEMPLSESQFGVFQFLLIAGVVLLTILFGLKKLDPSERHPGMMVTLAFEGVIKLLGVIIASVIIYFLVRQDSTNWSLRVPELMPKSLLDVGSWVAGLVISAAAIVFLPRQFHVLVVENNKKQDIDIVRKFLPLYLFLITLFVLPVALIALNQNLNLKATEFSLLALPMENGFHIFAVFIFLAGVSASVGMMTLELTTISTIAVNSLVLPMISRFPVLIILKKHLLQMRWAMALVIALGAFFFQKLNNGQAMVAMGTISFAGVIQLAPATLLGLFSKRTSQKGALLGIISGSAVWFFTLFLPVFMKSNFLDSNILTQGYLGLGWLRPEAMFGITELAYLPHSVFLSLLFNVLLLMLGTVLWPASNEEEIISRQFFGRTGNMLDSQYQVTDFADKTERLFDILFQFIPKQEASELIKQSFSKAHIDLDAGVTLMQVSEMVSFLEAELAGRIGTAEAHRLMSQSQIFSELEKKYLSHEYAKLISELRISPVELQRKIELYTERERLFINQVHELKTLVEAKGFALAEQTRLNFLQQMMSRLAHEINNPLAIVRISAERLSVEAKNQTLNNEKALLLVDKVLRNSDRIANVIKTMARMSDRKESELADFKIQELIEAISKVTSERISHLAIEFVVENESGIEAIRGNFADISQALLSLIVNSIDAIEGKPDRWIKIRIEQLKKTLRIRVIDSGGGIPHEIVDKIMSPFFTTKDIGKGTGIGLSFAKKIIEEHRGKIYLDTEAPNTCFIIDLPIS